MLDHETSLRKKNPWYGILDKHFIVLPSMELLPADVDAACGQANGQNPDQESEDPDPPLGRVAEVVLGGDPGRKDGDFARRGSGVGRGQTPVQLAAGGEHARPKARPGKKRKEELI